MLDVYLLVMRLRSDSLIVCRGRTGCRPFAPPKGMSTTAVFHVMREANGARTSLTSAAGWKRVSALVGAARGVVLDAVAVVDLDRAVVHADRHGDGQLAPWFFEQVACAFVEAQAVGGAVEELIHFVECVHLACLIPDAPGNVWTDRRPLCGIVSSVRRFHVTVRAILTTIAWEADMEVWDALRTRLTVRQFKARSGAGRGGYQAAASRAVVAKLTETGSRGTSS